MNRCYHRFRHTQRGCDLTQMIDFHLPGLVEQSRLGRPAVIALMTDLEVRFGNLPPFQRTYVGAKVREVMERHGHRLIKESDGIAGGYFKSGAVYSHGPV